MERRKARRVPADALLEVHDVGGDSVRGRAVVRNFGPGGMAVESHVPLREGETLFLKINVPVEFLGRVVYARTRAGRTVCGVKFSRIGFFDKLRLGRYITAKFRS